MSGRDSVYGSGDGDIFLDDVECLGNETNLFNCSQRSGSHDCTHDEDAAVVCMCKLLHKFGSSYYFKVHIYFNCATVLQINAALIAACWQTTDITNIFPQAPVYSQCLITACLMTTSSIRFNILLNLLLIDCDLALSMQHPVNVAV